MAKIEPLKKVPPTGGPPLVGYGLLTYRFEDGKEVLEKQGEIRNVIATGSPVGDIAIVDWFDWIIGDYTFSGAVPLSKLAIPYHQDGFVKLFPSAAARNCYYEYKHGKG